MGGDLQCLASALEALDVIMERCWPRIQTTTQLNDIVASIAACWLNLQVHMEDEQSQAVIELRRIVGVVKAMVSHRPNDGHSILTRLVEQQPELGNLFGVSQS